MTWLQLEHTDADENPCVSPEDIVQTVEDVCLLHFRDVDKENIDYLPVAVVLKKLKELKEKGILESAASSAVLWRRLISKKLKGQYKWQWLSHKITVKLVMMMRQTLVEMISKPTPKQRQGQQIEKAQPRTESFNLRNETDS